MKALRASLLVFVLCLILPQQGAAKTAGRLVNYLGVGAEAGDDSERIDSSCDFDDSAQLLPRDRAVMDDTHNWSHSFIEVIMTIADRISDTLSKWYGYDEMKPVNCKTPTAGTWLLVLNRSL